MKSFINFRTAQTSATFSQRTIRRAVLGLVAGFGLAASSPAQAQQAQSVHTKTDSANLMMTVENPSQQRMQVQVVQMSSQTCLSNEINHQSSYGTKLNFASLPAGEYAVLVRVGRERYRYAVQVQAQNATISVREQNNQTGDKAVASAAL
ncbi:hypothetical protein [Hymenobacter negativus]|uniref:DUF2846 domain-containing protein n=1 Tax=Hymenobacter negativus TaxID=2795026 RepID=A0ABS3QPH4_9BACT|nr:hypothetical protein [Hymenobacter negativus]MBO2012565.1 hypothetical protein [Hymenobacter negativus]